MSELVERVARALYETKPDNVWQAWEDAAMPVFWDHLSPEERAPLLAKARAAIGAMREPTKEMITAADDKLDDCIDSDWDSGGDGCSSHSYERVRSDTPSILWKTMIDEALK